MIIYIWFLCRMFAGCNRTCHNDICCLLQKTIFPYSLGGCCISRVCWFCCFWINLHIGIFKMWWPHRMLCREDRLLWHQFIGQWRRFLSLFRCDAFICTQCSIVLQALRPNRRYWYFYWDVNYPGKTNDRRIKMNEITPIRPLEFVTIKHLWKWKINTSIMFGSITTDRVIEKYKVQIFMVQNILAE